MASVIGSIRSTTSGKRQPHSLNLFSLQARGKYQESARVVRALLDLLREDEANVHYLRAFQELLSNASLQLKILDPELGEEELIKSMAAKVAEFREKVDTTELQQAPGWG